MERIFKNRGAGKRQVKLNESYFESIGDSVSLTAMLTHDSEDEDQDSVDEDYVGHDDSGMESSSSVESDNESIDAGSDMGIEKNQDDENGEGEGDVNESNGTIARGYSKDEIVVVDFSKWKALQPKVCCICQEKQKDNDNPLLICRNEWCEVGVHKECYGVLSQSTPKLGQSKWNSWKCHRCEAEALPHKTQCILCTYPFGAMKKYFQQDGSFAGWVHIICAMWADNADYDGDTVDNFTLDAVGCGGFRRNCSICQPTESAGHDLDLITGYTKQCQIGTCKKWVHLSCAEKYNLIEEHEELHDTDPFFVCCLEHGSVQPPVMTEWAKWCSKQSKLAITESGEPFRMVTRVNWVPKGHITAQVANRDSEIRSLVSEFLNESTDLFNSLTRYQLYQINQCEELSATLLRLQTSQAELIDSEVTVSNYHSHLAHAATELCDTLLDGIDNESLILPRGVMPLVKKIKEEKFERKKQGKKGRDKKTLTAKGRLECEFGEMQDQITFLERLCELENIELQVQTGVADVVKKYLESDVAVQIEEGLMERPKLKRLLKAVKGSTSGTKNSPKRSPRPQRREEKLKKESPVVLGRTRKSTRNSLFEQTINKRRKLETGETAEEKGSSRSRSVSKSATSSRSSSRAKAAVFTKLSSRPSSNRSSRRSSPQDSKRRTRSKPNSTGPSRSSTPNVNRQSPLRSRSAPISARNSKTSSPNLQSFSNLKCVTCQQTATSTSVVCYKCGKCYHRDCLNPPLQRSPSKHEAWICNACVEWRALMWDTEEDLLSSTDDEGLIEGKRRTRTRNSSKRKRAESVGDDAGTRLEKRYRRP